MKRNIISVSHITAKFLTLYQLKNAHRLSTPAHMVSVFALWCNRPHSSMCSCLSAGRLALMTGWTLNKPTTATCPEEATVHRYLVVTTRPGMWRLAWWPQDWHIILRAMITFPAVPMPCGLQSTQRQCSESRCSALTSEENAGGEPPG